MNNGQATHTPFNKDFTNLKGDVSQLLQHLNGVASSIKTMGNAKAEAAKNQVIDQVKNNPWRTISICLAAGFLAAKVFRRSFK